MACSPMDAAVYFTKMPPSEPTLNTTPRTPISLPMNYISVRSALSARGQEPRQLHSGPPFSYCPSPEKGSEAYSPPQERQHYGLQKKSAMSPAGRSSQNRSSTFWDIS